MQAGATTISVGGGTAVLTLPDVSSMMTGGPRVLGLPVSRTYKFSDDFGDEIGWNLNGSIIVPVGAATISLKGFWASIDQKQTDSCSSADNTTYCLINSIVDDPGVQVSGIAVGTGTLTSSAERSVNHWGSALESEWSIGSNTALVSEQRFAIGVDIRGIDQDIDARFRISNQPDYLVTYDETLDTRYYGAYLAWGGDYEPLLFASIWKSLGLKSSFRLQAGVYYADTDYEGQMIDRGTSALNDPTSALSLSRNDIAFIGGLTTETSKQIGPRTTLSLKSQYEYYSWVPDMSYNQVDDIARFSSGRQGGTRIGSDDAFSVRTSLRLTIGLGPDELYAD